MARSAGHTPDDIVVRKADTRAWAIFVQVSGNALRDHLQDLAAMTTEEAWLDAIAATRYIIDPPSYGMTVEEAETRLVDALDKLVEQVGVGHFTMGPVLTGRVSAQLDAALAGAA